MMDVGWGELLLLAGVALLIFGPDKLPKAAADAGRMVRKLREMASSAQQDFAPGVDMSSIKEDLRAVADLHPKRIMNSALSDVSSPTPNVKGSVSDPQNVPPTAVPGSDGQQRSKRRLDPDAT
jgi:Tat protein translocase TatB subunit